MKRLRTMISWTGAALVLVPIAVVLVVCPLFFSREQWDPLLKRLCRALARAFGYLVRTRGLENLPRKGGFVLVCNHVNLIDAFLLFGFLPSSFRGLEQLQHFSWPVYGALIRRFGNIALDQSGGGRTASALRAASEALKEGTSLLVLPEGHRTRNGRFGPFMRGAFRLANRTGAVLVPVVQRGGWEVFHKGASHVSPGPVDLIVLPPWPLERRAGLDDTTFCALVRQEMEGVFNQVQSQSQSQNWSQNRSQSRSQSRSSGSGCSVPTDHHGAYADCPTAPADHNKADADCPVVTDVLSSTKNSKEAPCA